MRYRMNKKQVLTEFRAIWADLMAIDRRLRGDSIAKREAFNNYVDQLNKERRVTDKQAYTWLNPF
jgi:hypothetical protein